MIDAIPVPALVELSTRAGDSDFGILFSVFPGGGLTDSDAAGGGLEVSEGGLFATTKLALPARGNSALDMKLGVEVPKVTRVEPIILPASVVEPGLFGLLSRLFGAWLTEAEVMVGWIKVLGKLFTKAELENSSTDPALDLGLGETSRFAEEPAAAGIVLVTLSDPVTDSGLIALLLELFRT